MLNNTHELLFLVAKDFIQLSPLQQVNIGIRLKLCGVEISMLKPEDISAFIFKAAYDNQKMTHLIKEIRPLLYE